jgi:hypothetical protein
MEELFEGPINSPNSANFSAHVIGGEMLLVTMTHIMTHNDKLPKLLQRPPLDGIEERELDLLLLLELHTSPTFRELVFQQVTQCSERKFVGAWRSVSNHLGETDLLLLSEVEGKGLVAILIEDKIDASFQHEQAERYRQRGRQGVADGMWDFFYTCLFCPMKYAPSTDTTTWDCVLTLEQIATHMRATADTDLKSAFLASALQQAVRKFEVGGFVSDRAATAFWQEYQRICFMDYKDLSMTPLPPVQSRNAVWPRFSVGLLPSDVRLEHKAERGCVDITFQRRALEDVKAKLWGVLQPGITVERTRPSCALRRSATTLRSSDPFAPQERSVREALDTVRMMLSLWPQIREALGYW